MGNWELTELRCRVHVYAPGWARLSSGSEHAAFTLTTTLNLSRLVGKEADIEMRIRRGADRNIAEGEVTGVHALSEGDALQAWRDWAKNAGVGDDYRVFMGPCLHGRDPYDRCDICAEFTPEAAKALAEAGC